MKRLGTFLSVLFLAVLVLLGSGGFTIGKMICGGNECSLTYSFGAAKDCCDNSSSSETIKSCCCELINVSYSLDNFIFSQKASAEPVQIDFLLSQSLVLNFQSAILSSENSCAISDLPPPDTKELLFAFRSLLL